MQNNKQLKELENKILKLINYLKIDIPLRERKEKEYEQIRK